jgi:FkbM family methyltransferase
MSDTSAQTPKQDHDAIVRGLYRGFLGREPDPAGLQYWRERLGAGASPDELLAGLMASAEYREAHGGGGKDLPALKRRVSDAVAGLLGRPLTIVDIGAQELENEGHVYAPLTGHGLPWRIVGFEPQQDKIEASRRRNPDQRILLLPTFIGDGEEQTFHINNDDATSSLLPFNEALTSTLADLDHLRTLRTERVATSRLDDALADIGAVDFLKLDIQGFEYPVLRHAPQVLARTNAIHCEVAFAPIYAGQALFSEVEQLLRGAGFYLLDFSSLCRYPGTGTARRARDRLGWGDAVFLREPQAQQDPTQLLAQMLTVLLVYDKPSAAQALARRHDELSGTRLAALFEDSDA